MTEPCRIIGVLDDGPEGLTPKVLSHLSRADLVIGGTRTLGLLANRLADGAETRDLTGNLTRVPDWIREARGRDRRVVVLATGDPLCHGIAGFLQARLPLDACELFPNVSTIQLACARLGLPWQDLKICSVHGRDTGEWLEGSGPEHGLYPLLRAATQHRSLGVLTSAANTPDRVARMLVQEGLAGQFHLAVAEHLLQWDERVVTDCSLEEAAGRRFADPNVVLLWRSGPSTQEVLFGLDDRAFRQRKPEKGLITKREVRAVSLARLQLRADSIVWDIGAGSGSVGLEAARLAHGGHVYAIEKNPEDLIVASHNRRVLGVRNYTLVQGKAPERLDAWPDPDAVFVGGSGGELIGLIALCLQRLKSGGTLVMNFATLENLSAATAALKRLGAAWDLTQMQASRSRPILELHRLVAENPIWILCAQREDGNPEQ